MATELGQAYIQIMPSARGIKDMIKKELGSEIPQAGQEAGESLSSKMLSVAKKAIAAAGIGKFFSASLTEGANLQQSLGGIETLFKGSADTVKKYANEAYKTTGLSANAYMENVTGFSASLLQSLGGDTRKAADVANMAMIDMADNSNKMGTSMDRIQDAYQGFAKQNYTMLDNLKLGYGGTKTEMQRLLADAQKLTGVKYDINNLSDVYQAIHAIQENLDITGTTAKEAATTFSGSFASMKAAAQNVLGKLALGEDIMPSLHQLFETVKTFLVGNLIPMVWNVLKGIPQILAAALGELMHTLFGDYIGESIMNDLYDVFDKVGGVVSTIYDMIFGSLSKKDNIDFLKKLGFNEKTASSIVNIGDNIRTMFENIGAVISNIAGIVGDFISDLFGLAKSKDSVGGVASAFEAITKVLADASGKVKDFTKWMRENKTVMDVVKSALAGALAGFLAFKAITIIQSIIIGFKSALLAVKGAVLAFNAAIAANPIAALVIAIAAVVGALVWFFTQTETGKKIWGDFVDFVKGLWTGLVQFFTNLWSNISEGATNLWNGAVEVWNSVIEGIKNAWNGIVEFFTGLWEGISSAATTAWTTITETVMAIVQPFIEVFISIWNGMKDGLGQIFEGIKMIFSGAWELIKSIVMGAVLFIIDLVTLDFTKMGEDLGLIWESIKSAISMIWDGICTYFSGIISTIIGYFTGAFEGLKTFLSGIWDSIKATAEAMWNAICQAILGIIDAFVAGAKGLWEGFKSFMSGLWEGIKSTAIGMWEGIKSGLGSIIDGIVSGAQKAWDTMKNGVSNLCSGIKNFFSGLANINLWDAGKAILDGFLGGLKSAYDGVKNFIGGIANWIREHKGPISYDRKLLIPAGKAIMGGFDDSLQNSFKDVQKTVGGVAGWISDSFTGDDFDFGSGASFSKDITSTLQMPNAKYDTTESRMVSEMMILRSSLDTWLEKISNKDSNTYLDGEKLAINAYQRQGRIMAREGI
ncbi:PblA [Streptococcus australis]|uniref:PblA n=1 Tax=Streptococcus australis TaxID=113107 RepID=UPI00189C5A3E|nr:PblA [Streptococcus australis]